MDVYTADPDRDGRPGALVASGVVIRKPGFGWLVEIGDDAIEWVACDLETRLQCLPVGRIRHMSDYWELRSVEEDHVRGLA